MSMNLKDDRWCFACGTHNPHGLRLGDIHLEGLECCCTFTPQKHHQGWSEILHGGITSTLLDEMMTHVLYRRGYDAVTAEMTVRLKKAIPLEGVLKVRGRITRLRGKLAETEGEVIMADGSVAALATAKFFVSRRGPDEPGGHLSLAAREAVLFDLFGTLVPVFRHDEYFAILGEMGQAVGMAPADFADLFRKVAHERTLGRWATIEENLRDLCSEAGIDAGEEQIAEATRIRIGYTRQQVMNPYPDALATLRALKEAGRPIGLISDCSPEVPLLWDETPLAEFIPSPVLSCVVGLRKPDARIYQLACERLGVDPYRAVFVGDGDSNEIQGAAEVGLCPILVDRGETSAFRVSESEHCGIVVHDLTQVLPLIGLEAAEAG